MKRAKSSTMKLVPKTVPFGMTATITAAAISSRIEHTLTACVAPLAIGAEHQQRHGADRQHDLRQDLASSMRAERRSSARPHFTSAADFAAPSACW